MTLTGWTGLDLGERIVSYDADDVMLYALSVGASPTDLPLVFEDDLHVLPTFAMPLGLWVADAASAAGAFEPAEALHGEQSLRCHRELPRSGRFEVRGTVRSVRDTGRSAILDIDADCEFFTATYSIILPGKGGFTDSQPMSPSVAHSPGPDEGSSRDVAPVRVSERAAALYRLTGDMHRLHIDPDAARAAGFPRPILHGLCTLAMCVLPIADAVGCPPWTLRELSARFAAPVFPGDTLQVSAVTADGVVPEFVASVDDRTVIKNGSACFE